MPRSKYRVRLKPPMLIACPFCGGEGRFQIRVSRFPYRVECVKCHAKTADVRQAGVAVIQWNRRTFAEEPK